MTLIKIVKYTYFFGIIFLFIQCKTDKKSSKSIASKTTIKYANGFDIVHKNNERFLIIKRAFQSSDKQFSYKLTNKTDIAKNELKIPIKKIVVTSTTHIPMLELLQSEQHIVGFPNTKYVSSKKTRKLIDNETIQEIGSEQNINTEKLLDLHPDLVVGFSLHPNNKVYQNIKKMGIPVIFNSEWLEETPLGRAEWIKFFGVLFNKEQQADSIFKKIEANYIIAQKEAKKSKNTPSILSGNMFKNVWYVPAGESFIATFLNDANCNYLWKNTKGTGSLSLNFENVFEKAQNADFWIGCGMATSKNQLENSNNHCRKFQSFQNNKVYTNTYYKGEKGGIIYFELASVRPDLVLKDLIKITHPKLLPSYQLSFFKKLK